MKSAIKIFAVLIIFSAISCNRPQSASTIVLIVRHAEKASDADDSPLTEKGSERARALVRVAEDAGVTAIYNTQFKRSQDTAAPLAQKLGITTTEMPVNLNEPGDYGKQLASDILKKHSGQTVLVIGHSNTVASIVEGLTGRAAGITSVEYPDLFIVTVSPSGTARVIKTEYGFKEGN